MKKDSNRIGLMVFQEIQKKHEAVPLRILFIYAPRHFLASDVRYIHHFLNSFHAFRNLRNIDFALSYMDVLATNALISSY